MPASPSSRNSVTVATGRPSRCTAKNCIGASGARSCPGCAARTRWPGGAAVRSRRRAPRPSRRPRHPRHSGPRRTPGERGRRESFDVDRHCRHRRFDAEAEPVHGLRCGVWNATRKDDRRRSAATRSAAARRRGRPADRPRRRSPQGCPSGAPRPRCSGRNSGCCCAGPLHHAAEAGVEMPRDERPERFAARRRDRCQDRVCRHGLPPFGCTGCEHRAGGRSPDVSPVLANLNLSNSTDNTVDSAILRPFVLHLLPLPPAAKTLETAGDRITWFPEARAMTTLLRPTRHGVPAPTTSSPSCAAKGLPACIAAIAARIEAADYRRWNQFDKERASPAIRMTA